jgi:hypothetical protein
MELFDSPYHYVIVLWNRYIKCKRLGCFGNYYFLLYNCPSIHWVFTKFTKLFPLINWIIGHFNENHNLHWALLKNQSAPSFLHNATFFVDGWAASYGLTSVWTNCKNWFSFVDNFPSGNRKPSLVSFPICIISGWISF